MTNPTPQSKSQYKRLVAQGAIVNVKAKAIHAGEGYCLLRGIPVTSLSPHDLKMILLGIRAGLEMAAEQDFARAAAYLTIPGQNETTRAKSVASKMSAATHAETAQQIEVK